MSKANVEKKTTLFSLASSFNSTKKSTDNSIFQTIQRSPYSVFDIQRGLSRFLWQLGHNESLIELVPSSQYDVCTEFK